MGHKFSKYKLRKWSVKVRWRDRKCQVCGSRERLEAHHIYDKSYHPEKAYHLSNGVTLCGSNKKTGNACHRFFHCDFMGGYRRKCTRKDWKRFNHILRWASAFDLTT